MVFAAVASSLSWLFNLVENVVLQQRRIGVLFTIGLQYRCSQSSATKSEHFSVPRSQSCVQVFLAAFSFRDRARQILFFATVRVSVGRSRSLQAQSPA